MAWGWQTCFAKSREAKTRFGIHSRCQIKSDAISVRAWPQAGSFGCWEFGTSLRFIRGTRSIYILYIYIHSKYIYIYIYISLVLIFFSFFSYSFSRLTLQATWGHFHQPNHTRNLVNVCLLSEKVTHWFTFWWSIFNLIGLWFWCERRRFTSIGPLCHQLRCSVPDADLCWIAMGHHLTRQVLPAAASLSTVADAWAMSLAAVATRFALVRVLRFVCESHQVKLWFPKDFPNLTLTSSLFSLFISYNLI